MIIDVNAWTDPWPALVNVPYDVASVRSSVTRVRRGTHFHGAAGSRVECQPSSLQHGCI